MFPDAVPENFSISATKAAYLVTEALGPYFMKQLLRDLDDDDTYITLCFDETGNVKNEKELQVRAQYWSKQFNKIINRFLITYFIERGTGEIIFNYLLKALNEFQIPLRKVLTLGMDPCE